MATCTLIVELDVNVHHTVMRKVSRVLLVRCVHNFSSNFSLGRAIMHSFALWRLLSCAIFVCCLIGIYCGCMSYLLTQWVIILLPYNVDNFYSYADVNKMWIKLCRILLTAWVWNVRTASAVYIVTKQNRVFAFRMITCRSGRSFLTNPICQLFSTICLNSHET